MLKILRSRLLKEFHEQEIVAVPADIARRPEENSEGVLRSCRLELVSSLPCASCVGLIRVYDGAWQLTSRQGKQDRRFFSWGNLGHGT